MAVIIGALKWALIGIAVMAAACLIMGVPAEPAYLLLCINAGIGAIGGAADGYLRA